MGKKTDWGGGRQSLSFRMNEGDPSNPDTHYVQDKVMLGNATTGSVKFDSETSNSKQHYWTPARTIDFHYEEPCILEDMYVRKAICLHTQRSVRGDAWWYYYH